MGRTLAPPPVRLNVLHHPPGSGAAPAVTGAALAQSPARRAAEAYCTENRPRSSSVLEMGLPALPFAVARHW